MGKIYACDNCHFLFERAGNIDRCPDCGKQTIRPASGKESEEFQRLKQEFGHGSE